MHIGIHCFEYPPCNHGGIGSFTKDLAEGLLKKGYEVSVFGFYYNNVLNIDETVIEIINGVKVYRYPEYKRFKNKRLNLIFSRLELLKKIKVLHSEKAFDIIESPENEGWLLFGLPFKIPLITRLHGGTAYFGVELNRKSSTIAKYFEKYQLKNSNHIVSVSNYTGQKTLDVLGLDKDYSVIYNSVQLPQNLTCQDVKTENNLIVFSGSILPKKGVEELVKAMNLICKDVPTAKLILAGKNILKKDGKEYKDYLLNLVEDEHKNNVEFVGSLNREKELFPLLCKAHVCCYPSHTEAFAIAPLEAMALSKPVVYSKLSSGTEALVHEESGLLCDPKSPESIAENILLVLKNKELSNMLASNGKERIEKLFNYNKWLEANALMFENYKNKEGL